MFDYIPESNLFDEFFLSNGQVRPQNALLHSFLKNLTIEDLKEKESLSKNIFISNGITFTVYSEKEGIEKIFPFDIIPRIITASEWYNIEKGIKQRIKALNCFLQDIYHEQQILNDKIIPAKLIYSCPNFIREMIGVHLHNQNYITIAGIDLIRDNDGEFYVLEDNLRTPSGVSYMIENREVSKRIYSDLMKSIKVLPVNAYANILYSQLAAYSTRKSSKPTIVLLTPGIFNSAYYEHSFLARFMGIELVESKDLIIDNNAVFMKTTHGLKQVDVIYKRVDDEFLDPLVFRKDSVLGIPGIFSAFKKGNVALVNAIGNGVADDKAIYPYVPEMIKYYLNETPILKNIPTYCLENESERDHVFKNITKMVLKQANGSGGYGMLMGNKSSDLEIEEYKLKVIQEPRNYIAQPIINLSSTPCLINDRFQPRRVDLRPFVINGLKEINIVPGGLTRVALKEGSLVVNSSQGGGSKDTWIIDTH